jgi:hypothetical protein
MTEIVPFHGNAVALAAAGRLDVRAMVKHHLVPFEAAEPFSDLTKVLKYNYTPEIRSCRNRKRPAAIHNQQGGRCGSCGHGTAVCSQGRAGREGRAPDPRRHARNIPCGADLDVGVLRRHASDGVDGAEAGEPYALPAVASAAREMWRTAPTPPAISTFLTSVRTHQQQLDDVFQKLCDIIEASEWAEAESVKKPVVKPV